MREVAAEELIRPLSGAIAELQKRQPAMAGFLPHDAERVVFSEEFLRRVVRIFSEPVHHHQTPQAAARFRNPATVVGVDADAADFVLDGGFVSESVGDNRRVGPDHELVVVVRM